MVYTPCGRLQQFSAVSSVFSKDKTNGILYRGARRELKVCFLHEERSSEAVSRDAARLGAGDPARRGRGGSRARRRPVWRRGSEGLHERREDSKTPPDLSGWLSRS